jgi:predicted acetyltransferase
MSAQQTGGTSGVVVRPLADVDDDLEAYFRIESHAFGTRFDPTHVELKRGIVDPGRYLVASADGAEAGVAGSFAFDLTLPGGAAVPVAGVSDVGVVPTQRRRGVLRSLLARLLDDAVGRGEVAAVLTASEATIYERFGFGVSCRWRSATVPIRRAALRADVPEAPGSARIVRRDVAAPALADVYERSAANGSLSRTPGWWEVVLADQDIWIGGHPDLLVVLHEDPSGVADAYGIYRIEERWTDGGPMHRMEVHEVVGTQPAGELAVWRVLLGHDLVEELHAYLPVDHVLGDVVADPRTYVTGAERDHVWLCPLDVGALLSARTYGADASLVLEVTGGLRPDAAGRYRLEVSAGVGACERVGGTGPDLVLSVADLGSCALGGGSFRRLVRAGRAVEHRPGAAAAADAAFRTDPLPWTGTKF